MRVRVRVYVCARACVYYVYVCSSQEYISGGLNGILMGSRDLLTTLRARCRCVRRLYPNLVEGEVCLFCESYYELDKVLHQLARATVFDSLPNLRQQIIEQLTVDALAEFNRAVLLHILNTRISPFRVFTYVTGGRVGKMSQGGDILDKIVCFL